MRFLPHSLALLALAAVLGGAAAAEAPALSAPLPAHTALYSFADIYRLTVGNAAGTAAAPLEFPVVAEPSASAGSSAPADYQVRVAAASAGDAQQSSSLPTSYVFSIAALPDPGRWLLLLSGLALAGWVARRRLSNSL